MKLTKTAETASTITLSWEQVPDAVGYRFIVDGKTSHTWDPTRTSVKVSKGAERVSVEALGALDIGVYPPTTTPPEPPTGAYFRSDFSSGTLAGWGSMHDAHQSGTDADPACSPAPPAGIKGIEVVNQVAKANAVKWKTDSSTTGNGSVLWEPGDYSNAWYQQGADTWHRWRVLFPDGTAADHPGKFVVSPLGGWDTIRSWHANNGVLPRAYSTFLGVHPEWGYAGSPGPLWFRPCGGVDQDTLIYQNYYQTDGAPNTEANRIPIRFNHWYEIVIHIKFGTTATTGLAEWWVDGIQQPGGACPTIVGNPGATTPGVAGSLGLYRGPAGADMTSSIWTTSLSGPTRASVGG